MRKGFEIATRLQECCKEVRKKTYTRSKSKDPKHEIKHDDKDIREISSKYGFEFSYIKKILTDE